MLPFANPVDVDLPHMSVGRDSFDKYVREQLFLVLNARGEAISVAHGRSCGMLGFSVGDAVLQFDAHLCVAELIARNKLLHDVRPISALNANAWSCMASAFHLTSKTSHHAAVPPRRLLGIFRKALQDSSRVMHIPGIVVSEVATVDMSLVMQDTVVTHEKALAPRRYKIWCKIDWAIASLDARSNDSMSKLTDRALQARYGLSGRALVKQTRSANLKDPSRQTQIKFLQHLDLAAMLYNRTQNVCDGKMGGTFARCVALRT